MNLFSISFDIMCYFIYFVRKANNKDVQVNFERVNTRYSNEKMAVKVYDCLLGTMFDQKQVKPLKVNEFHFDQKSAVKLNSTQ